MVMRSPATEPPEAPVAADTVSLVSNQMAEVQAQRSH